jgi:hypothetical protein
LVGCGAGDGYEAGNGGQGMAQSADGVVWERISEATPVPPRPRRARVYGLSTPAAGLSQVLSGGSAALAPWEQRVVYQPFLLEVNGTFYDFYNAAGTNEYGKPAEESGCAWALRPTRATVAEQRQRAGGLGAGRYASGAARVSYHVPV